MLLGLIIERVTPISTEGDVTHIFVFASIAIFCFWAICTRVGTNEGMRPRVETRPDYPSSEPYQLLSINESRYIYSPTMIHS